MGKSLYVGICLMACIFVSDVLLAEASSYLHPDLPDQHAAMARTRLATAAHSQTQLPNTRRLLQSSSSAPANSQTPAGLLIYTPIDRAFLDADDFEVFFSRAYNDNSTRGIYLTPGSYLVNTTRTNVAWQINMNCGTNPGRRTTFEVNMEGTNLFMGNRDLGGISWDQCSNVYLHGVNMTYAAGQTVFTQGTITRTGDSLWTVRIDPGYPQDLVLNGRGHLASVYDTRRNLVQNGSEVYTGNWTSIGDGYFNVEAYEIPAVQVGMKLAVRGDTYAIHMTYYNLCNNFRTSNVAIYQSNVFAIEDNNGRNNTYNKIVVVPDPRGIPGTVDPPLFSTNADGIHVTQPKYGPTITNCIILSTGDDSIAAHGTYQLVAQVLPANLTITVAHWGCADPSCLVINVGDSLLMYSNVTRNLGTATVRSVTPTSNPGTAVGISPTTPIFNWDTANYFNLTFNSIPTLWRSNGGVNGLVTVPTETGNYARITGNILGNNRARGIYTRTKNSQIMNNLVIGSSYVGLLLSPETWYLESDFQDNNEISGNYVNVTGGGIVMTFFNESNQPGTVPNHRSVVMTNNIVQGSMHPVVFGVATKVTFTGNAIIDGACYPNFYNDNLYNQQTPGSLIYTSYTTLSTFKNNIFRTNKAACRQYGQYNAPYQAGPGNTGTIFTPCTRISTSPLLSLTC